MKEINDLEITEKEKKYLIRFEKSVKKIYLHYLSVGVLLCLAIVGVVMGIKFEREEGFLMLIIFGGLAIILFLNAQKIQKLYKIIKKIQKGSSH
jgi:predicted membrane channel-forming protein YqfA (hemolysin III family)